jgi:flagellar M-ring protein FliF
VLELWGNLKAFWARLASFARLVLAGSMLTAVVLMLLASWWATRTSYQVLFSDLSQRDAAAVVAELKTKKVPYELKDGGATVLVDDKIVLETRLNLMGSGVPLSGGVGFELFDNKNVGMTEYMQKIDYQRAVQGELARTIMANDQLKSARVHLVVGDSGLFSRDKAQPKAAVSVVLKPDARLANEQILGIQRLVAAAVSGLDPSQVTITDQRGVALSAEVESDAKESAVAGKLRFKQQADEYLTRKVAGMLDRTFGPGQAIVSVDTTLNFDEIRRTQQSITPLGGRGEEVGAVVHKRESVYRQPTGQALIKAGDTVAERPTDATGTLTSTTDVEYELSKTAEQVLSTPGGIRRLSVGVIVPQLLNDDQLGRIRELVSMAVGFNAARGDAITVQPLDRVMTRPVAAAESEVAGDAPRQADKAPVAPPLRGPLGRTVGVVGLLALLFLVLVVGLSLLIRRSKSRIDGPARLSGRERKQLLSDIKSWIEAEKGAVEGVPKP